MPARVAAAWLPLIAAAVLMPVGCRPIGFAPRLVGVWVGVPETAEQRLARSLEAAESNKPADDEAAAPTEAGPPEAPPAEVAAPIASRSAADPTRIRSTLESIDVQVTLDLSADGAARMWVDDAEEEALRGSWRVAAYERDRATLEIIVERGRAGPSGNPSAETEAEEEKRRFTLQMIEGDQAFTLAEEGADRYFGRLYFRRAAGGL